MSTSLQGLDSVSTAVLVCRGALFGLIVMAILAVGCQASAQTGPTRLRVLKKIVIDPGHGGGNEGALGATGAREKDEVLEMAYTIRTQLERDFPDLEVVFTRTLDVDLPLIDRIHMANVEKADAFISIHMNAATNDKATGVEVFYLATDKSMPLVTEGEGSWGKDSDWHGPEQALTGLNDHTLVGSELPTILADLRQAEAHSTSADLAYLLLGELVHSTGRKNRGVRQGNYGVLRGALVPAVVVELGFLSNRAEEAFLTRRQTQRKVGMAFSRALLRLDVTLHKRNSLASK